MKTIINSPKDKNTKIKEDYFLEKIKEWNKKDDVFYTKLSKKS